MKPTAIFLGWIGKSINMNYGLDVSLADPFSDLSMDFFKIQTGLNISPLKYSDTSVRNILKKGYPVLVYARNNLSPYGHVWLIDYYDSIVTSYVNYYV